ncbi:MAG: ATP-dependent helicase, partial [Schwartzia sp.]|nr:ATP-dependent helicase [Schwartzia sp. (in: firmicutes)]
RSTEETKLDKLCAYINESHPYLMMVFCSTRERVIKLTMELAGRGYLVDEFHGELTQVQRALVLKRFRDAKLQIIVTTDIAARGLDIEGVTHVVNYDIPRTVTDYIHRIGRTGRAGREGEAITFVNDKQQEQLRRIEAGIKAHIRRESMKKRPEKTKKETPAEKKETNDSRRDKWAKPDKKRKPLTRAKAKAAAHSGRDSRNKKNRPAAPKAAKIGAPIKKRNKR